MAPGLGRRWPQRSGWAGPPRTQAEALPDGAVGVRVRAVCKGYGTYRTVAKSDGSGELDDVASTDCVMRLHERDQVVDRVVDAAVGWVVWLDSREEKHRAVSSSAAVRRCQ